VVREDDAEHGGGRRAGRRAAALVRCR
jgi:hypothetical protein